VGKALCSLVGGVRSWRASLPSFASVDLVGARPLSAKWPLEDSCLHRSALALLGGVASRLLAQPVLRAEPVFSSLRCGDSWDASWQIARPLACPEVIPTTLAPETGEVSWVCMGLRRVLFLAEVLFISVKVPGFFV
jgi:hypothetical protein